MRKMYLMLCALAFVCSARSQSLSLNDLVSYTAYTPSRFENSISKRGYRMDGFNTTAEGRSYTWHNKKSKEAPKEDPVEKSIFKWDNNDKTTIGFQTTSANEFDALRQQLKENGYAFANDAKTPLYQKGAITITPVQSGDSDKTVYSFRIERKALPKAKDILYAEDFLQLPSQEYLATVFGAAAVKPDLFYFSEHEMSRCTVLYPNTSMQVIFVWKDEQNLRDPAFILIGGQLMTQSGLASSKQIEQNVWKSKQGIYSGMSLGELQRLNGSTINIWDWQSSQPGVVSEKNGGTVDFKNLHLVLNCLDCDEDYTGKNKLLNSNDVLREGRRVYVSTIIVLPTKK